MAKEAELLFDSEDLDIETKGQKNTQLLEKLYIK